jgi:hypothetical protein
MKLIARLFPPSYVKEVIASLDGLTTIFEDNWKARAAFEPEMKGRIKTMFLKNPEGVKESAREPNYNPRVLCLKIIANMAYDDLASGRYHVYRGVLSMAGENKKALYRVAMEELVKAGLGTPETLRERTKELEREIKEMG